MSISERIVQLIDAAGLYDTDTSPRELSGKIHNLYKEWLKEKVDKLTVIDEEQEDQLYSKWEDEDSSYFEEHPFNPNDPNAPENWGTRLKKAQLQHTITELKEDR